MTSRTQYLYLNVTGNTLERTHQSGSDRKIALEMNTMYMSVQVHVNTMYMYSTGGCKHNVHVQYRCMSTQCTCTVQVDVNTLYMDEK